MKTSDAHVAEQLKDRRDYREALIHRRNETDAKISAVEKQIAKLKGGKLVKV